MASNKKYWKSEIELQEGNPLVDQIRQNEFPEEVQSHGFSWKPLTQVAPEIQILSSDKVRGEGRPREQQQSGVA